MVTNVSTVGAKGSPAATTPPAEYQPRPMIFVVRFCGAHPASIAAAIGQAIAVLDDHLRQLGQPASRQLFVIYRNHIEGAVTVQVGYPVSDDVAASVTGEISAGSSPAGMMIALTGETTPDRIQEIGLRLPESSASYTWQVFEESDFRPWTGKLVETLLVPAEFWPHVRRRSRGRRGDA
jgi:hypothetical protein